MAIREAGDWPGGRRRPLSKAGTSRLHSDGNANASSRWGPAARPCVARRCCCDGGNSRHAEPYTTACRNTTSLDYRRKRPPLTSDHPFDDFQLALVGGKRRRGLVPVAAVTTTCRTTSTPSVRSPRPAATTFWGVEVRTHPETGEEYTWPATATAASEFSRIPRLRRHIGAEGMVEAASAAPTCHAEMLPRGVHCITNRL